MKKLLLLALTSVTAIQMQASSSSDPNDCNLVTNGDFENFQSPVGSCASVNCQLPSPFNDANLINQNTYNDPDLFIDPSNNNLMVALQANANGNVETITIPLNRTIATGCAVQLSFMASAVSANLTNPGLAVEIAGSTNPPCFQGTIPPYITSNGFCGTSTVGSCSTFSPFCLITSPVVSNTASNCCTNFGTPNLQNYSMAFTNTGPPINYIILKPTSQNGWLLIDDVEVLNQCEPKYTVETRINDAFPCAGGTVDINYKICLPPGMASNTNDIELEVNLPQGSGLSFASGASFNLSGLATVPAGTLTSSNPCTYVTLNLNVASNAPVGVANLVELSFNSGGCYDSQITNSCLTVTPGDPNNTLVITKTATPGPYVVGTGITYTVTITNTGSSTVTDIEVQDILPTGVYSGPWVLFSANLVNSPVNSPNFTTLPFDLDPGESLSFSIGTTIAQGAACSSVENCATVIAATGACNLPTACHNTYVYNNFTPTVTNQTYCFGSTIQPLTVSGLPGSSFFWYQNSVTQQNSIGTGSSMPIANFITGPGTYTFQVLDVYNGCPSLPATVTVTVLPPLNFSHQVELACGNTPSGAIAILPQNGTAPYSFQLSGNGINQSGTSSLNYTFNNLPTGGYTVVVTDANGCTQSASIWLGTTSSPWPKQPITPQGENARAKAIDVSSGGAYFATGNFTNQIEFQNANGNNITLSNPAAQSGFVNEDGFIAKYNECGIEWAFRFGAIDLGSESGTCMQLVGDHITGDLFVGINVNGSQAATAGGTSGFIDATGAAHQNPINVPQLNIGNLINPMQKAFILKIDPSNGAIKWFYMIGDSEQEESTINELVVDPNSGTNRIYAIGDFRGPQINFGPDNHVNQGDWDVYTVSIDGSVTAASQVSPYSAGYSHTFGSLGRDIGASLDVGLSSIGSTNIYATGQVSYHDVFDGKGNSLTFQASPNATNDQDIFIARYNENTALPSPLALTRFDAYRSIGGDAGTALVTTQNGTEDFFITGYYTQSLDLRDVFGNPLSYPGSFPSSFDVFVSRIGPKNGVMWTTTGIGDGLDLATDVIEVNNSVFAVGSYGYSSSYTGMFATLPTTAVPFDLDIYIAELDPTNGNSIVTHFQDSDYGFDFVTDIETDGGDLYTAGYFNQTMDFPGQTSLTANGNNDLFIGRLNSGGTFFKKKGNSIEQLVEETETTSSVFPNPSTGIFKLELQENSAITVFDIRGKLMLNKEMQSGINTLNLEEVPSGVYLLRVNSNSTNEQHKIIKQ